MFLYRAIFIIFNFKNNTIFFSSIDFSFLGGIEELTPEVGENDPWCALSFYLRDSQIM